MPTFYQRGYRLAAVGPVFLLASLIQFWIFFVFNFKADLILVSLIISALFLRFEEILFFVFLGVWLLNSRVLVSTEMIYFSLLPLLVFFLRRVMPGKLWLVGFLSVLVGMIVFYSLVNFSAFYKDATGVFAILAPSLFFGLVFFHLLDHLLEFQG